MPGKEESRSVNGIVIADVIYKDGAVVTKEESREETIEVRTFSPSVPLAKVEVSRSITINMGDYESVKIGVSVELPTYVEQLNEAYVTAKNFADMRLNREATEIREARKSK